MLVSSKLNMLLTAIFAMLLWAIQIGGATTTQSEYGTHLSWEHYSFKTEPTFTPPFLDVNISGDTAPGHIFFAQFGPDATQNAATIMTEAGQLIWQSDPSATHLVSNLTPAKLFGEEVLLFWESSSSSMSQLPVYSHGLIRILDNSYQLIYTVTLNDSGLSTHGQFDSLIDPHEAFVTSSGTLLVLAYDVIPWDLTEVGGSSAGWIRDGVVYEIDILTNKVLFRWRGSNFIPITESFANVPAAGAHDGSNVTSMSPWDYLHLNSVTVFDTGILLSSRHTCNVYYINREFGEVTWTLQGDRDGEFTMTPAVSFCWQHDVHAQRSPEGQMLLSMFNNRNNGTTPLNETYGMLMALNVTGRSVTGVTKYRDPNENLSSVAGGSMQMLDNGNAFIGFGTQPVMKEFHRDGTLVSTLRFGSRGSHLVPSAGAYRVRKHEWKGCPVTRPKIAGCRHDNGTADVWMSWNGATEMRLWNVISGSFVKSPSIVLGDAPRTGFETKANVKIVDEGWVQAEAVGGCRSATELTRSEVVAVVEDCASW